MTNQSWYGVVGPENPITQGDIIFNCPLLTWVQDDKGNLDFEVIEIDAIVMTQACDLAQNHVASVMMGPCVRLSEYKSDWEIFQTKNGENPTSKSWKKQCENIREGYAWNLAMINKDDAISGMDENRIVDFRELFTVPRVVLDEQIKSPLFSRPRLKTPYREHLSQALARFFMRVGLPTRASKSW